MRAIVFALVLYLLANPVQAFESRKVNNLEIDVTATAPVPGGKPGQTKRIPKLNAAQKQCIDAQTAEIKKWSEKYPQKSYFCRDQNKSKFPSYTFAEIYFLDLSKVKIKKSETLEYLNGFTVAFAESGCGEAPGITFQAILRPGEQCEVEQAEDIQHEIERVLGLVDDDKTVAELRSAYPST